MGRILAVDYGRHRLGLALSDELGVTARGLSTLEASGLQKAVAGVRETAQGHGVCEILIGMPLNMDGTRGPMAEAVDKFGDAVASASGIPVVYWDERLTSVSAKRFAREMGKRTKGDKGAVDRLAATLLLENYLRAQQSAKGEDVARD
jgi:putative Holliday junction resolvase